MLHVWCWLLFVCCWLLFLVCCLPCKLSSALPVRRCINVTSDVHPHRELSRVNHDATSSCIWMLIVVYFVFWLMVVVAVDVFVVVCVLLIVHSWWSVCCWWLLLFCCYRYIGLTSALAFEFRNAHIYRTHFDVAIAAVSAELSYKESASHPLPAESSAGCLRFESDIVLSIWPSNLNDIGCSV